MAKVVSINISTKKGVKKKPLNKAVLIENFGIENDAHAGNWHRQISLLAAESIETMVKKGKFTPQDLRILKRRWRWSRVICLRLRRR